MTRFKEFSMSPYHFKHDETRSLIAYLSAIYPNFNSKNCDRKIIYRKLFPKKAHDQQKLALLFTYTMRLLEDFLVEEQLKDEDNHRKLLLLKKLRKLEKDKTYFNLYKKYSEHLENLPYRDVDHYRFKYQLSSEVSAHPKDQSKKDKEYILQVKQNNLDVYFMSEKLRDICEMHVRSQLLKLDYDPGLAIDLVHALGPVIDQYSDVPSIYFYYHLYELIVNDKEENYSLLSQSIRDFQNSFRRSELQRIYDFLRNYCLLKTNQGHKQYLQEVFLLYKEELESGLLFDEDGILAEWHYKNIITAGINLGEMGWVKSFIEEYKDFLHPDLMENAYSYNLANFYFANEEFDKAQDLLMDVEYTDIRYSLNAKMLLLRLFYEKDEYDALQSLLESFRLFVKRNKQISEERYKGYYNLIKFARRVYNVRNHVGYSDNKKVVRILKRIEEELGRTSNIFYRSWLQSKIEDVKNELGRAVFEEYERQ